MLAIPRVWPRTGAAGVVIVVACLVSAVNPLWQWDVAAVTLSVAVAAAGALEARTRRSGAGQVAPLQFAIAVAGSVVLRHLGYAESDARLAEPIYDALLIGVVAAVATDVRLPTRSSPAGRTS